jgi:hypothetical protein
MPGTGGGGGGGGANGQATHTAPHGGRGGDGASSAPLVAARPDWSAFGGTGPTNVFTGGGGGGGGGASSFSTVGMDDYAVAAGGAGGGAGSVGVEDGGSGGRLGLGGRDGGCFVAGQPVTATLTTGGEAVGGTSLGLRNAEAIGGPGGAGNPDGSGAGGVGGGDHANPQSGADGEVVVSY